MGIYWAGDSSGCVDFIVIAGNGDLLYKVRVFCFIELIGIMVFLAS